MEARRLGRPRIRELPREGLTTAAAVFGITGVGATELFMYPYWCVEKGYARYSGVRDDSAAWQRRARGWVRVMDVDVRRVAGDLHDRDVAFYLLARACCTAGAACRNRAT